MGERSRWLCESTKDLSRLLVQRVERLHGQLLRLVLRIDSGSTAVMGVVLITASGLLASPTGMPVAFSVGFGIYQLAGAAALAFVATRPAIPPGLGWTVVGLNVVSGLGCLGVTATDLISLTTFGTAFMIVGAAVAAVYAALEYTGLRRTIEAGDSRTAEAR
ncbi:hypothetical protein [Frankia alni]|uniref:hypothetical protein n=2 Tax=Frankia TaxID=1854 RepID=UPI0002DDB975|nr:hypothetical protein [Frankia alni]